jgi:hypothetical protein
MERWKKLAMAFSKLSKPVMMGLPSASRSKSTCLRKHVLNRLNFNEEACYDGIHVGAILALAPASQSKKFKL